MDRHYTDVVAEARAAGAGLVLVERQRERAVVTLNDPDRLNPLGAALMVRLREVLAELAADESLRAIVLTGADPAFSAGGDLRLMRDEARPMLAGSGGAPELWRWIRMQFGGIARLITGRTRPSSPPSTGRPRASGSRSRSPAT
jgi:2-(1,2-epoxy-1,2-dihydrophenyl)acetyl-CoA isomerase